MPSVKFFILLFTCFVSTAISCECENLKEEFQELKEKIKALKQRQTSLENLNHEQMSKRKYGDILLTGEHFKYISLFDLKHDTSAILMKHLYKDIKIISTLSLFNTTPCSLHYKKNCNQSCVIKCATIFREEFGGWGGVAVALAFMYSRFCLICALLWCLFRFDSRSGFVPLNFPSGNSFGHLTKLTIRLE